MSDVEQHDNASENIGVRTVRSHQFLTMIVLVIITSLFMVYAALSLYQSSGSLQLDLSRPGYDSARKEATKDTEVFKGYSADGEITKESLDEFSKLYNQKAAEALIDIDAFSGDALSDQTLALDRD